jgi:hypothetical protein
MDPDLPQAQGLQHWSADSQHSQISQTAHCQANGSSSAELASDMRQLHNKTDARAPYLETQPVVEFGMPERLVDDASTILHMQQREAHHTRLLVFLLAISVAINAGFLSWPELFDSRPIATLSTLEAQHVADTDGDGVLDMHDLCPNSAKGWMSGRATDFDSDGCSDDIEDKDKDNDGILDIHDKCPYTPQKYGFSSNRARDFDSDGCADGVEDPDDDNDMIPNALDDCPLTAGGDLSDKEGCSGIQREMKSKARDPQTMQRREEKEPDKIEQWTNTIIGCGLQIILGGILSNAAVKADEYYSVVKGKVGEGADANIREGIQGVSSTLKKSGIRILCLFCVYCYLRVNRCALQSTSSWFASGVRAIAGSCPEVELGA